MEHLSPTTISRFIRLNACQRYLFFKTRPEQARQLYDRYGTHPQGVAATLQRAGQRFEDEILDALRATHEIVDLTDQDEAATIAQIARTGRKPLLLYQPSLSGTIGGWELRGTADLIELIRDRDGKLHALIADIKASREEQLDHRVQVAAYAILLEAACRRANLPLVRIVGAIVHRGVREQFSTLHESSLHFDLTPYRELVLTLIDAPDAPFEQVRCSELDDLPFAFSTRCDGCQFGGVCLPHAAERADVALIADVDRPTRSALKSHEIHDLPTLAALKQPDSAGKLQSAPEHADRLALLMRDPVLAPQIDHLVARAHALRQRFERDGRTPRLPDPPTTGLPDPAVLPHLIQVFLDLQADDVTGLVYLAGALLRGRSGERSVVCMADEPPTDDREGALLDAWAADLERAIGELAEDDAPPLHVLVYDRRAQRIALEACARHEARHPLLGVLVAWLQEQPQIDRATCATLREIVRQQHNLRLTCDSLYAVAPEVWAGPDRFRWQTATHDFRKLFKRGVFDSTTMVVRADDGFHAARTFDLDALRIEAASRFSSQIPSEYAYAIWEGIADTPGHDDLLAFAAHRLQALAHLETASRKSRQLSVPQLPMAQLATAAEPRDLQHALRRFMQLEHTAALADLLAHVRLPIERRTLTGRTALLESIAVDPNTKTARFRFVTPPGGMLVQPRFKAGDWAVLNEHGSERGPWDILRGRLVIVSEIGPETIEVELTSIGKAGKFKLGHDTRLNVELRCRYTLDEMADDLLGDRVDAALDHLASNPLARQIEGAPAATAPIDDALLSTAADDLIGALGAAQPTAAQQRVIRGGARDPLRLVQGPPGTGKSRTLGLAVVARLLAAARAGRPLRVAVTAKTHSAVLVALDSIARAWSGWQRTGDVPPLLADLPVVKLAGAVTHSATLQWADPRRNVKMLRGLLNGPAVIGGTPGGLDRLIETLQSSRRWEGLFDLLLIDEASQMSLPEGLLAASALRPDGQIIVVGDHRQMPPIIAHDWHSVAGSLETWQPQRSLFKWLLDLHAPVVALDESFRLHRDHAAFLQQAIYQADNILFHSRRTDLLPPRAFADPLVDAALRAAVPLTVVEHAERGSRQQNEYEAGIVAAIVRACLDLGLDERDGIGVVVPHRAQKALLRQQLPQLADAESIDTVERFQGGERDVIIVACTASDPEYVMAEAAFLLDPQRLNVALSRARKKLIVVASTSVFGALPIDLALFQQAMLWKRLRAHVAGHVLWSGTRESVAVRVMGPPAEAEA